jgi:hypothetical protein
MKSIEEVDEDGSIRYKNSKGEYHRTDGPAIEYANGTKIWYINDKLHREDGPAIVFFDGTEWYYLNQKRYSKEDWEEEVVKLKLKRLIEL